MTETQEDLEKQSAILQLRTVAYELSIFHESLLQDRQGLLKNHEQMIAKVNELSQLVVSFQGAIKEFEAFETKVSSSFKRSLAEVSKQAQEQVGKRLVEITTQQVAETTKSLKNAADLAIKTLDHQKSSASQTTFKANIFWMVVSVIVICTLIIWGGTHWMIQPDPLTEHQKLELYYGRLMERVWPQLNTSQQHEFVKLYAGHSGTEKDVNELITEINETSMLTKVN
jgi:hypothetical protein